MKVLRFLLLLPLCACYISVGAQPADPFGVFEWFYEQKEISTITIEADLRAIERAGEPEPWLPALIQINDGPKTQIRVKARGNMRKKTCAFPPLKIKFAPEGTPDSLGEWSELKMVLPCFFDEAGERLVMRELLCYKLYNIITDSSFRAVPVRVQLLQEGKMKPSAPRYAFLIEPEASLLHRVQGRAYKPVYLPMNRLEPRGLDRMALFQLMIGNTDWSVENRHNVRIVAWNDRSPMPVPYDFDYAGIVNAPYAAPQKGLSIRSATERVFLGLCRDESEWVATINQFQGKKDQLIQCVDAFDYLLGTERDQMRQYLEVFFKVLDSPEKRKKYLLETCKSK